MRICLGKTGTHFLVFLTYVEENWSTFNNTCTLSNLTDRFIKITQSLTSVPWCSVALSKAVEKKHHPYNRYLHSMFSHDFHIYAKQRNLVKSKIRSNYIYV